MRKLSKQHFWTWFSRHNEEYLALRDKPKKEISYWQNELAAHLRAYFKFLGFVVEWRVKHKTNLIISVNGKSRHFKKVEDLVAKAPEIPGWTILALSDPRPIDYLLGRQIQSSGIDPRELLFSISNDDWHSARLIVYHPLCTPENEFLILELARGAVYNLLGERSFGRDIEDLQVANLSAADPDEVKELEALPEYIGMSKSGIIVDEEGNLWSVD